MSAITFHLQSSLKGVGAMFSSAPGYTVDALMAFMDW
jgi:hypothetical protein